MRRINNIIFFIALAYISYWDHMISIFLETGRKSGEVHYHEITMDKGNFNFTELHWNFRSRNCRWFILSMNKFKYNRIYFTATSGLICKLLIF